MVPSGCAAARANASAAYSSPRSRLRVVTASDRTTCGQAVRNAAGSITCQEPKCSTLRHSTT